MKSILSTLYRECGKAELSPSVELDAVWQLLGELGARVPDEEKAILDIQECMLAAIKRTETDGFSCGFRCAAALWRECV